MKNKQTRSDVIAMHTNSTEKACSKVIGVDKYWIFFFFFFSNRGLSLTRPLYLKESWTERRSSQKGHKNSKRNMNMKSATITIAQSIRNFI